MAFLLRVVDGLVQEQINLDKQYHIIGRHPDSDIRVDDIAVSGKHAMIEAQENDLRENRCEFILRDLGSTNGTFVNESQVTEWKLEPGDIITIASSTFRFVTGEEARPDFEKTVRIMS